VFRDLDSAASGSASIAQVHRATLQDGTPVVLKIRRPGVRATSKPTCASCASSPS
jgi:ubiquinone biosynthesis protein